MRKILICFPSFFTALAIVLANGAILVNVEAAPAASIPFLSLCRLMKDVDRYDGRLVRVRVVVLGAGGHYPLFITAEGCDPENVVALWIKFEHRDRIEPILEQRLFDVLRFNLESESRKAEAIIVGRVSRHKLKGRSSPRLMLSVKDVETQSQSLVIANSRRTSACSRRLDSMLLKIIPRDVG
jgi:hypothetical protein